MSFDSYFFAILLGVAMLAQRSSLSWKARKVALLVVSYVFYASGGPAFLLVLVGSTVVDWFMARAIQAAATQRRRRAYLMLSLVTNIGLLVFFKYGNMLLEGTTAVARLLNAQMSVPHANIVVPIGISFYTFQTLSYTLDVYMRRAEPARSFLDYALYVTFFPQLVAGPIVRAPDFLPQCEAPHRPSLERTAFGAALLLFGIFEKVVLADFLFAPAVDPVFVASPGSAGLLDAWTASFAFGSQLFCDFAGYSTSAIGAALMLGFELPTNFRFPYAAVGLIDFWRRWHISLSTWLRDYLYIPLGGRRGGPARTALNLFITMFLSGLWHKASWTFLIWGGANGVLVVVERELVRRIPAHPVWRLLPTQVLLGLLTFTLWCFTLVYFRAESFSQCLHMTQVMFGIVEGGAVLDSAPQNRALLGTVGVVLVHWLMRDTTLEAVVARVGWPVRAACLALIALAILITPVEDRAFIYFQF